VPLGAMILSDALCAAADVDGKAVFSHGFTYAAHPVACAAAMANLRIIETESLCEHVRRLSPSFLGRLQALADLPLVGDVRGMGLLAGVEFVRCRRTREPLPASAAVGKQVAAECRRRGLMVRPLGSVIGISPPLIITEAQVDEMVGILREAIRVTADALTRSGIQLD